MKITESRDGSGAKEQEVTFEEHRLEEITARLNRFERVDETAFRAVAAISQFNQQAYELFVQPAARATANEATARLGRFFHPLRVQQWSVSDWNPWLSWLGSAALRVKENRHAVPVEHPLRKAERAMGDVVGATLDCYRDLRDAMTEATFFMMFGNPFALYLAEKGESEAAPELPKDPQALPFVKAALQAIEQGGYPAALARAAELLERQGARIPLARIELGLELKKEYAALLPDIPLHEWKMLRGEQDIIVRFEPERALATLPKLLSDQADRERFLQVLDRVVGDRRLATSPPTEQQIQTLKRIRTVLGEDGKARRSNGHEATA